MDTSKKDIYSHWVQYTTKVWQFRYEYLVHRFKAELIDQQSGMYEKFPLKNEETYFRSFIRGFVEIWEAQLKLDWKDENLPNSNDIASDSGPLLSRLPEELLPAIGKFLYITKDKTDKGNLNNVELNEAELLARTLILISRNFGNIPILSQTNYVQLLVSISSSLVHKVINSTEVEDTNKQGLSLCTYCCHLLECIYDPYFTWRFFKKHSKLTEKQTQVHSVTATTVSASLHTEIIPFIFELFEQKITTVAPHLGHDLLNVLGGIICGSQKNALTGICPATVSLLVMVISDEITDPCVRVLAVKCFVIMVHTLLSIEPHQRQIEVGTLMEVYRGCLTNVAASVKSSEVHADAKQIIAIVERMIDAMTVLIDICTGEDCKRVRCVMIQNYILEAILDVLENIDVNVQLLMCCVRTIGQIMRGETFSKERMSKINGYGRIFRRIKLVENASRELLVSLVEMLIEERYIETKFYKLQNAKLIVPLLHMIPFLDRDNQEWLVCVLFSACTSNLQSKWKGIKCGAIKTVCDCLEKQHLLTTNTVMQLINLLETLASISISTSELKSIFQLFLVSDKRLVEHYLNLLQALSCVTRTNSFTQCRSYFDIQSVSEGISVPDIKNWPGPLYGFTFHCWFQLNKVNADDDSAKVHANATSSYRRQLLTLSTATKCGVEIFINSEYSPVVLINTKKEFFAISVYDFTFEEDKWYSMAVMYIPAKRPFAQNQICIYVDGILLLCASAKFAHFTETILERYRHYLPTSARIQSKPIKSSQTSNQWNLTAFDGFFPKRALSDISLLQKRNKTFTWCRIGAPLENGSESEFSTSQNQCEPEVSDRSGIIPSFISQVPNYLSMSLRGGNNTNRHVKSFPPGMQDTIFGPTVAFSGQLTNICLFQEPLSPQLVRLLFDAGIDFWSFHCSDESSELSQVHAKLVLAFSPSACAFDHALDLCAKYKLDARTTAAVCSVRSLKNIVNSVGGANVLLPFLETENFTSCLLNFESVPIADDESTFSETISSNFRNISETQLEENPVAAVIVVLNNLLKNPANHEYFMKRHGFAMLGHLLTEVSTKLMDLFVLTAVCLLYETFGNSKNTVFCRSFHHHIVFNFDIWSRCNFEVQQGHAQFLFMVVKKDKKYYKKRFGVPFFLDTIRRHYASDDFANMAAMKDIRHKIMAIIYYYIHKDVNVFEIRAIVGYMVSSKQECLIMEMLDLLISILQSKNCRDQIYLLLYERHTAELLYALLIDPVLSMDLKQEVLKLFWIILGTEKVYERSKHRLRLQDSTSFGMYPGLIASFPSQMELSADAASMLLDQILNAEHTGSYAGALVLLHHLSSASLDIKLEAARKFLAVVFIKASALISTGKQVGWQDCITRLLVNRPIKHEPYSSFMFPDDVSDEKLVDAGDKDNSKTYPSSLLTDVASLLDSDLKGSVSSLVSDNLHLAANNLTLAAENVSTMVAENIQYAASNLTSAAENVSSMVTGNFGSAAENISSAVSSAYSLITQKSGPYENDIPDNNFKHLDNFQPEPVGLEEFLSLGFEDLLFDQGSGSLNSLEEERSLRSNSKWSPGSHSRDSASMHSVQSGSNESDTFDDEVVFEVPGRWDDSEPFSQQNGERELCSAIVNILFVIMWKGYDTYYRGIWKDRGQVIACINMLSLNNILYCSHMELKLELLEMMANAALVDLLDPNPTESMQIRIENANQMLRWIYDLMILDPNQNESKKMSSKLLNSVVAMMDAMQLFREDAATQENEVEMVKISLSILLRSVASQNTDLCAIASAKLHAIVQTRDLLEEEGAFIFYQLWEITVIDLKDRDMERYSFLAPVIKTTISKLSTILAIEDTFPGISTQTGLKFYDRFQELCQRQTWIQFVDSKIKPLHDKYYTPLKTELAETMNIFWAECYEAYKTSVHKRNKLISESKIRFHEAVCKPFEDRMSEENARYNNLLNHHRNNKILLRKKWQVERSYLVGTRRAWKQSEKECHWKLSHYENFSRMRLKLIPNVHFNSHIDASNLRDNTGWAKSRLSEDIALPLNISQAALRKESELTNEQISEEENLLNKLEENEMENKQDLAQGTEKLLVTCECELVTLMSIIKGRMEITTVNIYFHDHTQIREDSDRHDFKCPISRLREIYLRRYNLRKTALEFFLTDQTNYFVNFTKEIRNNIFTTLLKLRPPNLLNHSYKSPSDLLKSGLTQKWVNREITNFDYLMQLNTIAGRTYNDLSQYPVFPWVIADYESDELDLNCPSTFRDLSKPIGVVNAANEAEVKSKYNTFEDPCGVIAKFHYGTHYSNSAGVLHYLVRVEPFTTLHIELQSGRFDVADRQFHSIPQTWKLLMENPNDVKELIPEFFYFPEFLKNINKFDLGNLQGTKEKVNDVILPKWASSPEDFIYKHRKALESEYVSSHLHEWIDLIFGYKQRGPAAIEALNVFYYCSYEGAVDLDAIEDPMEREAVEGMINNFGQTPSQLMKEPHPARLSQSDALLKMLKTDLRKPDLTLFFDQLSTFHVQVTSDRDPIVFVNSPRSLPKGFLQSSSADALITVSRNGCIAIHSWMPFDKNSARGFSIELDESVNNPRWRRDISGTFHPSVKLHSKLFVVSQDSKFLFTAGHWDCSVKVYHFSKSKFISTLSRHTDIVTCLAADSCNWFLISGSQDCTCIIWDMSSLNSNMPPKVYQLLHGHDEPISCVSISTELDMAVSGSLDGTVNVYTIHEGHLVHVLRPEGCATPVIDVPFVTISVQGHIAFSIADKVNHSIHVYSINGVNLGSKYILGQVTGLTTISDCLVVTDDAGDLTVSRLLGLHPMYNVPLHIPIQSVVSTVGNTHLLVPLRDGHLVVVGLPNNYA